jgi:hypothetical protein
MGLGLELIRPSVTDWIGVFNRNMGILGTLGEFVSPQTSSGGPSAIRTRTPDGNLVDAIRIVPQADQTLKIYLGRVGDSVSLPAFDFALPNHTAIPLAEDSVTRLKSVTEILSGGVYIDSSLTLKTSTVEDAELVYEDTMGVAGFGDGSAFQMEYFPNGSVTGFLQFTVDGKVLKIPCFT